MIEKHPVKQDEIDIFHFFRPLTNLLQKIGRAIFKHLRVLQNHWLLALFIFILISGIGYAARFVLPKGFTTEALFASRILPTSYCQMMITNLNELNNSMANGNVIANRMKISPEAVADIKSVSLTAMSDSLKTQLSDSTSSVFKVQLVLSSMKYLDTIQQGLINYLGNSEFSIKRQEARLKTLMAKREGLHNKVLSLDTLKNIVNNSIVPRSQGQGIILGEPLNPVLVYEAEEDYYDDELKINEEIALFKTIELIHPFLGRSTHNYPDFGKIFLMFILVGIITSIIVTPFFATYLFKSRSVN